MCSCGLVAASKLNQMLYSICMFVSGWEDCPSYQHGPGRRQHGVLFISLYTRLRLCVINV